MRGKILLLTHKRQSELRLVLNAIKNADLSAIDSLLTIQQDFNPGVSKILEEINWINHENKSVIRNPLFSIEQQINSNLFTGISFSFLDSKIDFISVLEDDIVVSFDFFNFAKAICIKYNQNSSFRGVNGFSGVARQFGDESQYCLYRYGLGWGWTITRDVWLKLSNFWNGCENEHWDGLLEHYIKTGFVAMPILSKIRNIGFGNSATHTLREVDSQLHPDEKKLLDSFVSTTYTENEYQYILKKLNWRRDCLPYLSTTNIQGKLIDSLYKLNWTLWRHTKGKYRSKTITSVSKIIEQFYKRVNLN